MLQRALRGTRDLQEGQPSSQDPFFSFIIFFFFFSFEQDPFLEEYLLFLGQRAAAGPRPQWQPQLLASALGALEGAGQFALCGHGAHAWPPDGGDHETQRGEEDDARLDQQKGLLGLVGE